MNSFEDIDYGAGPGRALAPARPRPELASRSVEIPRRSPGGAMELHDVTRRIIGRYWWLLAILMVVCAGAAAVSRSGGTTYTATARIVLDSPDPTTRVESAAIADTVKAIATSQFQVTEALRTAGADRDPLDVAEHHVSVSGLGSSSVVKVSVSDHDKYVAANVANALAAQVIATRRDVSSGGVPQEVANLSERIDAVSAQISRTDNVIDRLNVAAANAPTADLGNQLRAQRDAASRRRDFLAQQRSVLESERVSILGAYALRPKPQIISRASVPLRADASGVWPYAVLGGLLGLILGIGLAALIETVRPTVVGGDALARELDAPLLGTLYGGGDGDQAVEALAPVAARVRLAAEAVGVDEVALLSMKADVDVRALARSLEAATRKGPDVLATERSGGRSRTRIVALDLASPAGLDERRTTGLVLVSPSGVGKADLVDVGHLLRVTPMPLLGLIVYKPVRLLGRHGRRRSTTELRGMRPGSASSA